MVQKRKFREQGNFQDLVQNTWEITLIQSNKEYKEHKEEKYWKKIRLPQIPLFYINQILKQQILQN